MEYEGLVRVALVKRIPTDHQTVIVLGQSALHLGRLSISITKCSDMFLKKHQSCLYPKSVSLMEVALTTQLLPPKYLLVNSMMMSATYQ